MQTIALKLDIYYNNENINLTWIMSIGQIAMIASQVWCKCMNNKWIKVERTLLNNKINHILIRILKVKVYLSWLNFIIWEVG